MKTLLTLSLGAILSLGLLPSKAEAAPTSEHRDHSYRHRVHRNYRRVYHPGHWIWRAHHRVFIPARTVVIYL